MGAACKPGSVRRRLLVIEARVRFIGFVGRPRCCAREAHVHVDNSLMMGCIGGEYHCKKATAGGRVEDTEGK